MTRRRPVSRNPRVVHCGHGAPLLF
jgi:hypothetical protein